MKQDKRIIANILYIVLGAAFLVLGILEIIDAFWSGMGGALIAVGVIRIVQFCRFRRDETYREKVEIETKDERNQYLRVKAWAWAGYLFILIAAVSTIIFKLLGQDLLSMAAGFAICFIMLLYWVCYLVLRKKY